MGKAKSLSSVTDPEAIHFSNSTVRPGSERLCSIFKDAELLHDRDASIGTPQLIQLHENRIRLTATSMIDQWNFLYTAWNVWFNVGTGGVMNTKFPNDNTPVVDGAPEDGRPPITGSDVHNAMSAIIRYRNWLLDGAFNAVNGKDQFDAMTNTIIVASTRGNSPLVEAQVDTLIDNRCQEIIDEYTGANAFRYSQLLAVAPNPEAHRV